eukprot:Em0070g12a
MLAVRSIPQISGSRDSYPIPPPLFSFQYTRMKAILLVLLVQGILVTLNAQPCNQDGATRLLNFTPDVYAGFVQVCFNRTWGTVCGDSPTTLWSEKNGQVFCIGLGYSGALNSVNQST